MIIPTADYDPLFADDGVPFGEKMRQYIHREFADILGPHAKLLSTHQGLETLRHIFPIAIASPARQTEAA